MTEEMIGRFVNNRYPWFSELLNDPDVSDIWINGPGQIYVERNQKIEQLRTEGVSETVLRDLAYAVASTADRPVSTRHPVLEASWQMEARIQAVLPPLSRSGTTFAVRKPQLKEVSLDHLQSIGFCTAGEAEWLRESVRNKRNLIVSGATGSGKTTLIQALTGEIPTGERLLILEDTPELKLPSHLQGVCLQCRQQTGDEPPYSLEDLVRIAMRMRPDRMLIGEVRGREAFGFIQAMNTGHAGGMTSIHANSAQDALLRLETLLMLTEGLTPSLARRMISRTADVLIHAAKDHTGKRRIAEMVTLKPPEGHDYDLQPWHC